MHAHRLEAGLDGGGPDPGDMAEVPGASSFGMRAKNRVHLDRVDPVPPAGGDLARVGAAVVGDDELPGRRPSWTVMQDLEGNQFCIAARSFTGWDWASCFARRGRLAGRRADEARAASSAPYRAGAGSAAGGQADEGACLPERQWPAVAFPGVRCVAGAGVHHD
jgi:hypothetical protein